MGSAKTSTLSIALIVGLIVVIVIAVILALPLLAPPTNTTTTTSTTTPTSTTSTSITNTLSTTSTTSTLTTPSLKEFTFTIQESSQPWGFLLGQQQNPTLTVNKGDTVKVTLQNTGALEHSWYLTGYNIGTKVLLSGQSDTIQFNATTTGTFTYLCTVPGHTDLGMIGQFIVQ